MKMMKTHFYHLCYLLFVFQLSDAWLFSKGDGVEVNTDGEVITPSNQQQQQQIAVTFINQSPKAMDIYWDDGSYGQLVVTKVEPRGGKAELSTFVGHTFHWTVHGRRQQVDLT